MRDLDPPSAPERIRYLGDHCKHQQQADGSQDRAVNHADRWTEEAADDQQGAQDGGDIEHFHGLLYDIAASATGSTATVARAATSSRLSRAAART